MKLRVNDYSQKDIVKFIREWTELNQNDFGKSIHKSIGAIRKYESGERNLSFQTFMDICDQHGIIVTIEKK